MFQTVLFLALSIILVIALIGALIVSAGMIIDSARKQANPRRLTGLKRALSVFAIALVINVGLVVISQLTAATPRISDEAGNTVEGSIAELVRVELNGRAQWITIRGFDARKPVLLFLAGGPGGSQLAAARHELSELEKHFVVVGWDQPGAGKSYRAAAISSITPETYVEDGLLTEYLMERFEQDKIYLVGESWGSALGVFLVDRRPDYYHALIGTGQMIDFAETERLDYARAMEIARANRDTAMLCKLEANGAPPYYGKGVTWRSAVYLNYLNAYDAEPSHPQPGLRHHPRYTVAGIRSGRQDHLRPGVMNTFNNVYQQLTTSTERITQGWTFRYTSSRAGTM